LNQIFFFLKNQNKVALEDWSLSVSVVMMQEGSGAETAGAT
jgi:hypothetical protein